MGLDAWGQDGWHPWEGALSKEGWAPGKGSGPFLAQQAGCALEFSLTPRQVSWPGDYPTLLPPVLFRK